MPPKAPKAPKNKKNTVEGKSGSAASQTSLTSAMQITTTKRDIQPRQLPGYVGRELFIPGSYWGKKRGRRDVVMPDQDVMYPVKVAVCELERQIPGIAELQAMVRVDPQGPLVALVLPDEEMWIGIALFSQYITADDNRLAEIKAAADKVDAEKRRIESYENAELIVEESPGTRASRLYFVSRMHDCLVCSVCDDFDWGLCAAELSAEEKRRSSIVYEFFGPPVFERRAEQKVRGKTIPGKGEISKDDGAVYRLVDVHKYKCCILQEDGSECPARPITQHGTGLAALVHLICLRF